MKIWQKMLITLGAMLVASYAAGWAWRQLFDFAIPSYLAGVVGGTAAVPVWEFLRWIEARRP